jgi:hypothetical protein
MGLNEIKKLLHNKRNDLSIVNAAHKVVENHFQLYIWQRVNNTRIYRKLKKVKSQKITEPMKKWANELNELFQKKKYKQLKST